MGQPSTIPQQLMTAAILHFTQGVPIDDCDCTPQQKKRLARVSHVYWIWKRNPFLEVLPMFRQLVKGKFSGQNNEWIAANSDKRLFDFVVEQVTPSDRRVQEERVRFAANHLMKIGMETDNTFAIEAGMKGAIKIDRLDEPEDQRSDMSKVAFLPSVVVTNIEKIDPDKTYIDDEETRRIAAKYGACIPEQRKMVEDQVALMEARAEAKQIEEEDGDE